MIQISNRDVLQRRVLELMLSEGIKDLKTVMDIVYAEYAYTKDALVNAIYDLSTKWFIETGRGGYSEPDGIYTRYQVIMFDKKGNVESTPIFKDADDALDMYSIWRDKHIFNRCRVAKIDTLHSKILDVLLDDFEVEEGDDK